LYNQKRAISLSVLCLLLLWRMSMGQTVAKIKPTGQETLQDRISLAEKGFPVPTIQAIETEINPDEYIVHVGDVFRVNVWSDEGLEIPTTVTPEGKLIVKTVGSFQVAGKTLTQVKQEILAAGEKKYKLEKITADLIELRTFRVHVVGEVANPGTYVAQALDRVSVLIGRATGILDWADERHVEVRHTDGTVDTLDQFNFRNFGDLNQNIYVRNGDVIYVPALKLSGDMVTLAGRVSRRGIHPIQDGEMLKNFLLRVDGYNRDLDLRDIYVIRTDTDGHERTINIDLLGKESRKGMQVRNDLMLEDNDKIFVPSLKNKVYVHGAVNLPGAYYYEAGFTASDYIGIAGGTVDMGNLDNVKVIHLDSKIVEKGADVPVQRGDTIIVPVGFRRKFTDYLQIVTGLATLVFAYMAAQQ